MLGSHARNPANAQCSHEDRVRVVRMSPNRDNPILATGGYDSVLRLWDGKTGELLNEIRDAPGWVVSIDFDRGGMLACAWGNGQVALFDSNRLLTSSVGEAKPSALLSAADAPSARIYGVRFLSENQLVTSAEDGSVRVWTASDGDWSNAKHWSFRGHVLPNGKPTKVLALAVHRELGLVATGDALGRTLIWRPSPANQSPIEARPRLPYADLDLRGARRVVTDRSAGALPLDHGECEALAQLGAKTQVE